jgi:uncharacterized protein YdaU (DUF1376 family)
MAEFPALPIFTDAFIADTLHLNAAQTGAYFMLLMVAWRTKECALPDDDNRLAAFARMDKRAWMVNREIILGFFHMGDDGLWRQKRLSDERKHAEGKRNQAIQAGTASALKRKERHSTDVATDGQRKPNHPYPHPQPDSKKKEKIDKKEKDLVVPEDVSGQVFIDYIKHRKAKNAPLTQTVIDNMRAEAKKLGWTLEQAMIEGSSRGWQGFKADWVNKDAKKNTVLTQAEDLLKNGW